MAKRSRQTPTKSIHRTPIKRTRHRTPTARTPTARTRTHRTPTARTPTNRAYKTPAPHTHKTHTSPDGINVRDMLEVDDVNEGDIIVRDPGNQEGVAEKYKVVLDENGEKDIEYIGHGGKKGRKSRKARK